jgi:hypothetical protein
VLYINAARVPRLCAREGRRVRHHLELTVDGARCAVREVLIG